MSFFFSYKLYFLAATAATAATWRNDAIGAATLAATKIDELATKIWGLDMVNRVIKPFAIGAATLAATKIDELATKIWGLDMVNRVIKPFIWCCQ